jgi:predicted nucleotidyltransferase
MALTGGVDLVLELPLPWAMASAERFALGGVSVLHALGCVNTLSFGSECGDTVALQELAALIDTDAYKQALKTSLAGGITYAAARQKAAELCKADNLATLLSAPNNTLGLEYIRAATKIGANFRFHTLKRVGAAHNTTQTRDNIASASYIRALLREDKVDDATIYIPDASADILKSAVTSGYTAKNTEILEHALLARLRTMEMSDLAALPYISEGLEHRLYQAIRTADHYDTLLDTVKTRRYTAARLRRILWSALLGMPSEKRYSTPPYIRVLAMNERGREILSAAAPTLPILTRAAQAEKLPATAQEIFALECRATDLHALALSSPLPCGTDQTTKIITDR